MMMILIMNLLVEDQQQEEGEEGVSWFVDLRHQVKVLVVALEDKKCTIKETLTT